MMHVLITLTGKVQGVGFRPFVYRLAQEHELNGEAKNILNGLSIELIGEARQIDAFLSQLTQNPPKHAKISNISIKHIEVDPASEFKSFSIVSETEPHKSLAALLPETPFIASDRALCKTCLKELFTPSNRRYLHPFISCLECGPRASIIQNLPYERKNTVYASVPECDRCAQESRELINTQEQRFHSQTNSCWDCGPSLTLYHYEKENIFKPFETCKSDHFKVFEKLATAIQNGHIVAVKGISGFHLICDARQETAIAKLRAFKQRPEKPFALMALNTASLDPLVELNSAGKSQLESDSAPIVLFPKKQIPEPLFDDLAPNIRDLGCMLPYAPVHYLLFFSLLGTPSGTDWLRQKQASMLLVTSANLSGEPLISDNAECLQKLSGIAQCVLTHDRDIRFSSDDSVIQINEASSPDFLMIRRARGFAPEPIQLPFSGKSVLALGAYLKNTFCITKHNQAFISPHLGELNSLKQYEHFEATLGYYLNLYNIQPELIACDLHPDFYSSRFAQEYADKHQLPLIKVAHHQAHIAATFVEAQLVDNTRFIGLALDGIGLGENSEDSSPTLWGGELFYGNYIQAGSEHPEHTNTQFSLQHRAQLSHLRLPGGDKASSEIGRIAYALINQIPEASRQEFKRQLEKKLQLSDALKNLIDSHLRDFPQTSSLGRWFDAVSSLLDIRQQVNFEGQAAMELETSAWRHGELPLSDHLANVDKSGNLNLFPILENILSFTDTHYASAKFHSELVDGLLRWITWHSEKHQTKHVICSGGCFQNQIIRNALSKEALAKGLILHFPKNIPVNDAGISLGQAVIASLT